MGITLPKIVPNFRPRAGGLTFAFCRIVLCTVVFALTFHSMMIPGSTEVAVAAPPFTTSEPQEHPVKLTVSAAASLRDALTEITRMFERASPAVQIALNFGASGTLAVQIEQGAPVDVFLPASGEQLDALAAKNLLLVETRVNLLRNELVLVVPRNAVNDSKPILGFGDLARPDVRLVAMGDPRSVPAGMYARQVLAKLGIYEAVKDKTVLATDVRQVLADVETGSAGAGLVYATDAGISPRVRVVCDAPAGSHEPILYPAAVLRSSTHAEESRAFIAFLKSPAARAVFVKYGFRPAEEPAAHLAFPRSQDIQVKPAHAG